MSAKRKRSSSMSPREVDEMISDLHRTAIPVIPFPEDFLGFYFKEANRLGIVRDTHLPDESYPRCLNPQCWNPPGHSGHCDEIPF